MAERIEISCINKSNRYDPHERITQVGGVNPKGSRWKLTLDQTIVDVEAKTGEFLDSRRW